MTIEEAKNRIWGRREILDILQSLGIIKFDKPRVRVKMGRAVV